MKILSLAVPCYNSEKYMTKCIESLLVAGERVEIIIVDDGSTDSTPQIADAYRIKYPKIIKVIHQENGGHGAAVNTGLSNATGVYYKVVDSDDWLDKKSFLKVLDKLEELYEKNTPVDLMLCNFVYYKDGANHHKVMKYTGAFPENRIFTWEEKLHIKVTQYILMHSVLYKTDLLKRSRVVLPKKTFYVDNIFLLQPLPLVKTSYYMNVNLYQYYIGREDQSVNEKVMIGRIDQQINVVKRLVDIYCNADIKYVSTDKYMKQYIDIMMCVTSIMLIIGGKPEHFEKKKNLWNFVKQKNKRLYWRLRLSITGISMNLPGRAGRAISKIAYHITQKIFGFN